MAMRPEVRRRAIDRILIFCISSLGGALLIFVGLIYMVLKGNADKDN